MQPFRGSAIGASNLTTHGGTSTSSTTVGSDGKFCVEVQLTPDSPNTIIFTSLDQNGCPGKTTKISVTHKSTPKQDAGIPTIQNVALNQPSQSSITPDSGNLSYVNDGDNKSYAKFSFFDTGANTHAWIKLDLGKSYTISKIKIKWPPQVGDDYAEEYLILASSKSAPVDPDPKQISDWTTIKHETNGTSSEQFLPITPQSARWVALLLYENGSTSLWETFLLGDLEVWGQDPNATPPPPPDKCN